MSDVLTMRSFPNERAPTVTKIRSDGIRMYCEARYVIVLNDEGEVIEKINRSLTYTGNFLVVLAPVIYDGWKVNLSVVLEIGFSRSVPYQQYEQITSDGVRYRTITRRPVAQLTDAKIIELLSTISSSLRNIVDEETSHRKKLIWVKYGKDKREMLSGMFVSIPLDEASPLVYVCLEKDFISRTNGHLQLFVDLVKEKLRKLKFAYYPKGQIKRFKVSQEIASILFDANYPVHFLEFIRKKLGKETKKVRALFEQIVEEFEIKTKNKNNIDIFYKDLEKIFSEDKESLIENFKITVQTHPKRDNKRSVHAKDCLRIEIHPSIEAVQKKHGTRVT